MVTISSVNALVPLQNQAITTAPSNSLNHAYPLEISQQISMKFDPKYINCLSKNASENVVNKMLVIPIRHQCVNSARLSDAYMRQ